MYLSNTLVIIYDIYIDHNKLIVTMYKTLLYENKI